MGEVPKPTDTGDGAFDSRPPSRDAFPQPPNDWSGCVLGPPTEWPHFLQTFAHFITTLPHPAAIFWEDDLILIQNGPWRDEAGAQKQEQGKSQASIVSEFALSTLRSALDGVISGSLSCSDLLGSERLEKRDFSVLLSPIQSPDGKKQRGVIAQYFPTPNNMVQSIQKVLSSAKAPEPKKSVLPLRSSSSGPAKDHRGINDNIPLDDHPFFQKIAELIPTGLAILNHKAEAVFVNQQFYELTTQEGEDKSFMSWPQTIHPEDFDRVMLAYREAFESGETLRAEFRAQGPANPWRLLLLTPLGYENLRHASLQKYGGFICGLVDISTQKAAEFSERKAADLARERKEQLQRFIDMTSHEIRNPLSAILHCSEDIMECVRDRPAAEIDVDDIIEAAETITLCVSHQKNIVDDILSFSKLDASMLSLSPRSVQPKIILADSLKMFQPELRKMSILFDYAVDYSYQDFAVDWVKADLVRISQILVNLVTNAIKFTAKKDGEKRISVAVGASRERPTSYPPNVVFFDSENTAFAMDGTNSTDWGNGETLYMLVAVKDNGIGISPEGQAKLFERFRQATPKTEEIYGGSGLGLNISRKLCQLHGGEIGVSSKEGEGSTFGFFFKTRRTDIPPDSEEVNRTQTDELQNLEFLKSSEYVTDVPKDSQVPKTLITPPLEHVKEVSPGVSGSDRFDETARIAEKVVQKEDDIYAINQRPSIADEDKRTTSFETAADAAQASTRPGKAKKIEKVEARRAEQPRVLLVEDNIINQRILRRKLESKGFTVITANNGREAVTAVEKISTASDSELPFACILMDQEMPVLDGNGATKAIRQLERQGPTKHCPILGVTANVREEQKQEMIQAGMDAIIHKPYAIEDMVANIRSLMKDGAGEEAS
ncbi:hypothetical protein K402DRAFT_419252 [Aulographum hederae CBS 113979]|uniref:histidine kinase n=1 Tax=Aulographum hederae CBS 113979 TaxID=1176131 RepID=A0A6G1H7D9_9PEZI|nr:hypothetical protein K402DRAFT_419252 [Aulographum hederae CBS 113979]